MRRRTLDLIFSTGGLLVAVLVLILGAVLQNQANFAEDYVREQLQAQRITFTPAEGLSDEERQVDCLVEHAGETLSTGKQAECYANEYIGLHVQEINEGKTYAETSGAARAARAEADEAAEAEAPDADELEATAARLEGQTQALFRGETLRGLLLTTYGFSIFGERAGQAALVAFLVGGILALAAAAGFVHAFTTRKDEVVRLPFATGSDPGGEGGGATTGS